VAKWVLPWFYDFGNVRVLSATDDSTSVLLSDVPKITAATYVNTVLGFMAATAELIGRSPSTVEYNDVAMTGERGRLRACQHALHDHPVVIESPLSVAIHAYPALKPPRLAEVVHIAANDAAAGNFPLELLGGDVLRPFPRLDHNKRDLLRLVHGFEVYALALTAK
jgi:hypothetical protein